MTSPHDLERRLTDYYAGEAPQRAPDWLLERSLDAIDQTKQQRPAIGALRRIPCMTSFAKLAAAAVVVVGVVAFGAMAFRPAGNTGATASPTPSASPSPSPRPSPSFGPSPSNVAPTPPPLTTTFNSTIHGFSIDHPLDWVAAPATQPANDLSTDFGMPSVDVIHDPTLMDHLFLAIVSAPLDGAAGQDWATGYLDSPAGECSEPPESITIDGADGFLCGAGVATAWLDDRGYVIRLYTSGDEWWLGETFGADFFRDVLATVDLGPTEAIDVAGPSASP